jgi:hypothetical protein
MHIVFDMHTNKVHAAPVEKNSGLKYPLRHGVACGAAQPPPFTTRKIGLQ